MYRCIPFKYRNTGENSDGAYEKVVEVLMISTTRGPGLVFPKVEFIPFHVSHVPSFVNTFFMLILL